MPPSSATIREAVDADIDALVAIRESVAAEGRWIGRELPIDHEREHAMLQAAIASGIDRLVVAEVDGNVVGYTGLHGQAHGHGELFMALVDGHRGQGLGRAMLADVLAWAPSQESMHKVTLQVWPHNAAALALYRSQGFVVEGYRHKHWRRANGDLWDAIEMGLLLRS
jgi:putative acetyltransferase